MSRSRPSERFDQAVAYARQLHADQVRKGTDVPYLAHLLSVSALVLEDGGDEDQAIAGLLHDAAEDAGGLETVGEIRRRFGATVADIVAACSDSFEVPKPPWRDRKERFIEHLRQETDPGTLRVELADKLHNARSILSDYRAHGDELWERFQTRSRDDQVWYYRALVDAFSERHAATGSTSAMLPELERVVDQIVELSER